MPDRHGRHPVGCSPEDLPVGTRIRALFNGLEYVVVGHRQHKPAKGPMEWRARIELATPVPHWLSDPRFYEVVEESDAPE